MKNYLCLCICLLVVGSLWGQEGEIEPIKKRKSLLIFPYKKFEAKGYLKFPVQEKHNLLIIRAGNGQLVMMPNDKAELEVENHIYLTALGKNTALNFMKRFSRISITEKGNEIYLRSYFDLERRKKTVEGDTEVSSVSIGGFMGTPGSRIDLIVKVPEGIALKVYDGSGDIQIAGLKNDLRLRDQSGDIFIENVQGKLNIRDGSGKIHLVSAGPDTYIRDASGKIQVQKVQGNLEVIDGAGKMDIQDIQGNLVVRDASGHILIKNVDGSLTLKDSAGSISLDGIATDPNSKHPVKITDASGHIYLKNVNGELQVKDRSGKIFK